MTIDRTAAEPNGAAPVPGRLVGRSVPRRDAREKVTGRARFVDDLVFPGAWFGMTVRSTEPHARIVAIERDPRFDWSQAVVLTAADIPCENVVALQVDDQPALAAGEVRHVGEPVALVAAADAATARAARDAIHLRLEPLPAVLDPLEAERAFATYEIVKGDVDAGFAAADLIVEATYRTPYQEQLYLEPQGMIAVPGDGGSLAIHGSLQCPYYVHTAVARALGLEDGQLRIVQAETGGGFGGKEEFPSGLAIHAGMLALRLGRPVRMIYDRHEDLAATTKRHPAIVRHRTGVSRDGDLLAQEVDIVMDAGAYTTLSPVVLSRGALHAGGPYACPNVRIRARTMATNMPPSGAMRGFGAPQTEFAAEMQVDRIAAKLAVSPAALRRRWAYRVGDTTPTGQVLRESVGAVPALDAAVSCAEFEQVRAALGKERADAEGGGGLGDRRVVSGVGLALGWHGAGFTGGGERYLASVAGVELTADASIRVLSDSTEIGQGSRTVLAQLVADALGVPTDAVDVAPTDTSVIPNSGPTVASRTTMVVGGLLVDAARRLRAEVEERTGRPFPESYADDAAAHGASRALIQFGGYPDIVWDEHTYRGDAYPAFSYAAAVAKVDVDLDTGEVAVRSLVAADEIGTVVNPLLAAGQVEGGSLQGVGYATIEEVRAAGGRFLNDRLATYLIPTALDAPATTTVLLEEPFSGAPHGSKGLGELPMDVPAPAVVAAIHDATGAWIDELPASPERILAALAPRASAAQASAAQASADAITGSGGAASAGDVPDPGSGTAVAVAPSAASASTASPSAAAPRAANGHAAPSADALVSHVEFLVNGLPVEYTGPGGRRLIDVLRQELALSGTKEGCGEGECGTCSVLLDGELVTSCLVPVCQVDGRSVVTIEGLDSVDPEASAPGEGPRLHRLQAAFLDAGAVQCGFCTPGMVLAATAAAGSAETSDASVRSAIAGNLCRCTGYTKVVEAIRSAAASTDRTVLGAPAFGPPDPRLPVQVIEGSFGPSVESPATLADALAMLAAEAEGAAASAGSTRTPARRLRPIAGGTDLMVELAPAGPDPLGRGLRHPLLDLSRLAELRGVRLDGDALVVGATTTFADLRRSALVAERLPVLAEAAASIGAAQVQNRGTIGGNVMNASPAGDMLPVLLATDAELVVESVRGQRVVPAASFWPGYRRTALEPDELLVAIRFPLVEGRHVRFRKVGTRRAQAISKVVLALGWRPDEAGRWRDVRLGLGSVAPTPIRALETEALLEGTGPDEALATRAAQTVEAEISPIDDIRSTAAYRRTVAGRVLRRLIVESL